MDGLDLEFLQSKACKQAIVDTHVEGIIEYILSSPGLTGDLKRKTRLHHQHLISGRGTTGTINSYCNLWTRVTLIPKVANLLACED